jgi:hypothetical protein
MRGYFEVGVPLGTKDSGTLGPSSSSGDLKVAFLFLLGLLLSNRDIDQT